MIGASPGKSLAKQARLGSRLEIASSTEKQ
jgi:hypothetical protein